MGNEMGLTLSRYEIWGRYATQSIWIIELEIEGTFWDVVLFTFFMLWHVIENEKEFSTSLSSGTNPSVVIIQHKYFANFYHLHSRRRRILTPFSKSTPDPPQKLRSLQIYTWLKLSPFCFVIGYRKKIFASDTLVNRIWQI